MNEIFDDYIQKSVTKFRLNKRIKDYFYANKWLLAFFLAFPLLMDLFFGTFSFFSLVKTIFILISGFVWVYLKYLFVKNVLVNKDNQLQPWKYNLWNAGIWGFVITLLAIPSQGHEPVDFSFLINIIVVFIIGGLFSLLFTSLEMPRIKNYLGNEKTSKR
ncbi:hypothetical protein [Companilactobacillus mishanensis]|uniref:Uncharacterized protein n=1 Tax=Companilactobacillus mishanensis TaxID=2486008 RepID=A0A5P0ZFB8_9LACO|nr:hypothetical protein [Companilactobacillus mishanensis]MQS51675.1 hypothetical protein [Companilactobacillus mishanensis]